MNQFRLARYQMFGLILPRELSIKVWLFGFVNSIVGTVTTKLYMWPVFVDDTVCLGLICSKVVIGMVWVVEIEVEYVCVENIVEMIWIVVVVVGIVWVVEVGIICVVVVVVELLLNANIVVVGAAE